MQAQKKETAFAIRELAKDEFPIIYPFIKKLNPNMSEAEFATILKGLNEHNNYRCIAVYDGEKCLGVCGFWVGFRFYCGKYIRIDNIVVDDSVRSAGLGKMMTDWVEAEGKRHGCKSVILDSYVSNTASHKFYFRENYIIRGYHFGKVIGE